MKTLLNGTISAHFLSTRKYPFKKFWVTQKWSEKNYAKVECIRHRISVTSNWNAFCDNVLLDFLAKGTTEAGRHTLMLWNFSWDLYISPKQGWERGIAANTADVQIWIYYDIKSRTHTAQLSLPVICFLCFSWDFFHWKFLHICCLTSVPEDCIHCYTSVVASGFFWY